MDWLGWEYKKGLKQHFITFSKSEKSCSNAFIFIIWTFIIYFCIWKSLKSMSKIVLSLGWPPWWFQRPKERSSGVKKSLFPDVPWVIQFSYRPGWKFSLKFQLCWGKKTLCCIKWNKHWQCRYSSLLPYPSILLKADNKTKSWPSFLSLR